MAVCDPFLPYLPVAVLHLISGFSLQGPTLSFLPCNNPFIG